jgi:energy-coupling factor transport system ATP-binding protein
MISVEHLGYRYPKGTELALHDVSACVEPGEVVGIVGPNGSGKSTLGRLMKGLIWPTEGRVLVDGLDTRTHGLDVRHLVGLVFQNPNSQIVNAVVEQEVAFGLENIALPSQEIRESVDVALRSVGLTGRELEECYKLSMADKQRVALAAVMAMHPRYLILDEPTAWLEPTVRWPLLEEVLLWASNRGAALVLVTHRMDEAQTCDRLYGMLDGRVEAQGAPEDVLQNESVRSRLALDVPETFELAASLRAEGVPVAQGTSIDRLAESISR